MIVLIDAEKVFDKIQHPLVTEVLSVGKVRSRNISLTWNRESVTSAGRLAACTHWDYCPGFALRCPILGVSSSTACLSSH